MSGRASARLHTRLVHTAGHQIPTPHLRSEDGARRRRERPRSPAPWVPGQPSPGGLCGSACCLRSSPGHLGPESQEMHASPHGRCPRTTAMPKHGASPPGAFTGLHLPGGAINQIPKGVFLWKRLPAGADEDSTPPGHQGSHPKGGQGPCYSPCTCVCACVLVDVCTCVYMHTHILIN